MRIIQYFNIERITKRVKRRPSPRPPASLTILMGNLPPLTHPLLPHFGLSWCFLWIFSQIFRIILASEFPKTFWETIQALSSVNTIWWICFRDHHTTGTIFCMYLWINCTVFYAMCKLLHSERCRNDHSSLDRFAECPSQTLFKC